MSYYLLRDEYQISTERTYSWIVLGGVTKEINYLWSLFWPISAQFTISYYVLGLVSRTWDFMWTIGQYIAREFQYLYRIALDFSGKAKYNFTMAKITTRFFRKGRNG